MSKKAKKQNEVTNSEVLNLEAVVTTEELNTAAKEPQTNTVDEATKELEELKAKMTEVKQKLAEAKKANQKSRPVRMSTFVLKVAGSSEQISKSDVHYCIEKTALDILVECIKANEVSTKYEIYKKSKADDSKELLIETLWIDEETKQIVIK